MQRSTPSESTPCRWQQGDEWTARGNGIDQGNGTGALCADRRVSLGVVLQIPPCDSESLRLVFLIISSENLRCDADTGSGVEAEGIVPSPLR